MNVKGRIKLFSASSKHIYQENIARELQLVKTARSDAQPHNIIRRLGMDLLPSAMSMAQELKQCSFLSSGSCQ